MKKLIDATALGHRLKKEKNFLLWMSRRYQELNPDQAAAFRTGAELLEKTRLDLQGGVFDHQVEEVLTTRQPARARAEAGSPGGDPPAA